LQEKFVNNLNILINNGRIEMKIPNQPKNRGLKFTEQIYEYKATTPPTIDYTITYIDNTDDFIVHNEVQIGQFSNNGKSREKIEKA
jgi:hypothetical protein